MNHNLSLCFFAAVMVAGVGSIGNAAPESVEASGVLALDRVVSEVLSNNPTLKAGEAPVGRR